MSWGNFVSFSTSLSCLAKYWVQVWLFHPADINSFWTKSEYIGISGQIRESQWFLKVCLAKFTVPCRHKQTSRNIFIISNSNGKANVKTNLLVGLEKPSKFNSGNIFELFYAIFVFGVTFWSVWKYVIKCIDQLPNCSRKTKSFFWTPSHGKIILINSYHLIDFWLLWVRAPQLIQNGWWNNHVFSIA